jgi:uncharacterized protein
MTHGDEHFFTTISGRKVWPLDPHPEDIHIADIAHALAMICRFNGHVREFYSVAQHSVIVSYYVPAADALYGLLHDAAEAYLGDMSSEIKHDPALAEYREAEHHMQRVIYRRFGLEPYGEPPTVKRIDRLLLQDEIRDVALSPSIRQPYCQGPGLKHPIVGWEPRIANEMFIERFFELLRQREKISPCTRSQGVL